MGDDLDDLNSEEKQTSQRTVAQHLTHLDTIDKSSYINTKNKTLTSLLLSHARFRKYPTSNWWEFAWTLCRRNGKRGLNPSLEIVKLTQGQPSPTYPLHSFFVEAPAKAAQLTTLPQVPHYWCCSAETFGHCASCRKAATEETASNNDTWGKGQSEVHPKSGCQGKIVCQR